MKSSVKEIIKTTLALFLIAVAASSLLALANSKTEPIIEQLQAQKEIESRKQVLPSADSFSETQEASNGTLWCEGRSSGGETAGYVINATVSSYGGKLTVMVGIEKSGLITGVEILEINDTPALGMNAKEASWLGQYEGKQTDGDFRFFVTKDGSTAEGAINAITAATISSNAVTSAVNMAIDTFNEIGGAENG